MAEQNNFNDCIDMVYPQCVSWCDRQYCSYLQSPCNFDWIGMVYHQYLSSCAYQDWYFVRRYIASMIAWILSVSCMCSKVSVKSALNCESLVTLTALVWFIFSMRPHVLVQIELLWKGLTTLTAWKWFISSVKKTMHAIICLIHCVTIL